MERTRVVVVSGQALFAEGLASRLRETREYIDVVIVNSRSPQWLAEAVEADPRAVILDVSEAGAAPQCALTSLLEARATLDIVRVDPSRGTMQVIRSRPRPAEEIRDLANVLETLTE